MGENRLFTKFLRSFFWFVLLPFCVILAGVTVYANRLQLKNDMAQNENLAAQVVNAVPADGAGAEYVQVRAAEPEYPELF